MIPYSGLSKRPHLDITMSLKIELGKAAYIAPPVDVDAEFPEEIHNLRGTFGETEPQDEWRRHNADNLSDENHHLHRKEFSKLLVNALRVELASPLIGHVVGVSDDFSHEELGVKDAVLLGDHAPRNGEDASEDTEVEEDRAVRCDFEIEEEVGVEDSGKNEDSGEGARNEGDEPGGQLKLILKICMITLRTS